MERGPRRPRDEWVALTLLPSALAAAHPAAGGEPAAPECMLMRECKGAARAGGSVVFVVPDNDTCVQGQRHHLAPSTDRRWRKVAITVCRDSCRTELFVDGELVVPRVNRVVYDPSSRRMRIAQLGGDPREAQFPLHDESLHPTAVPLAVANRLQRVSGLLLRAAEGHPLTLKGISSPDEAEGGYVRSDPVGGRCSWLQVSRRRAPPLPADRCSPASFEPVPRFADPHMLFYNGSRWCVSLLSRRPALNRLTPEELLREFGLPGMPVAEPAAYTEAVALGADWRWTQAEAVEVESGCNCSLM
eukprot:TRINITY_DN4537_c2_g2_i1.p1 TRINITY_DN4537_c2_g2~~TRINITY_DN4537_c2_g2_i1.p1  ORF type:complete len:331 (+),score=72.71 TRINITY_DN4537_c2_g2_i1:90-995(+)